MSKKIFNKIDAQSISILSTLVNFCLGIAKIFFGVLISSLALIADGIHSSIDVLSSFITFLGLKIAKRPKDEKHPYGHGKAESIAGFLVSIILAITGVSILFEAITKFFNQETVKLDARAIIVVVISILVTEILARLKFHYGGKFKSLALIADAEHSRADALSSVGVLIGLFLSKYFYLADVIIAIAIGAYILFEAFNIGKEITDSLLDVSNKEVEERIKKICSSHNIEISELKTRKIGFFNFAEIKIKLPPKLKVDDVQKITEILQDRLLHNIPELKEIVISIESYDMARTIVLPRIGKKIGTLKGFKKIGPKKLGKRIIIPIDKENIILLFGSKRYLIIDQKDNKILRKETMDNPYFEKKSPHGARFAKEVRADEVIVYQIGSNAKQSLENFGIKIKIIPQNKKINDILKEIKEKAENEKD